MRLEVKDKNAFAKAMELHRLGKLEAALAIYRRLALKAPDNLDLQANMALVHYQAGRTHEAIRIFQSVACALPDNPGIQLNLGNCLHAVGRLEEASRCFQQAASLGPFPEAHYNLGNVLTERGLTTDAISHYRQALALRPDYPKAARRLAMVLALEACAIDDPNLLQEAILRLSPLVSRQENDGEAASQLARCQWRICRYRRDGEGLRQAAADLERLNHPEAKAASLEYARLLLEAGQDEKALAVAARAEAPPDGWTYAIARPAPFTWSADRPLKLVEERNAILLTGGRDWLVLRPDGTLSFEDMANANANAGQYVRLLTPSGKIAFAMPPIRSDLGLDRAVLIGGSQNYYHWMLDYFPRTRLIDDIDPSVPLLVNDDLAGFQRESLAALGIDPSRLVGLPMAAAVPVRHLIIPELGTAVKRIHPETLSWLKAQFPPTGKGAGPRILLSRADAGGRRIVNEQEMLTRLGPRGFTLVTLAGLSIKQQAAIFAEAEIIVAPHGAALTNLVFCRPSTQIFELIPGRHNQPGFFLELAKDCGLEFRRLECEPRPTERQVDICSPRDFDMWAPVDRLEDLLAPFLS